MAYYYEAILKQKYINRQKAYEELLTFLQAKENKAKWAMALQHLYDMEEKLSIPITSANNLATLYQLCPKCGGQGIVSKPPYVPGDVHHWNAATSTYWQCDVCNGNKIIPTPPL